MHSTGNTSYHTRTKPSIVGFAYVGEGKFRKTELWWVDEISDGKNYWPNVIPFSEVYLFSDISGIDFSVPVDKKTNAQVRKEISILLSNAIPLSTLNRLAKTRDKAIKYFPVNGSASSVNSFYEECILTQKQEVFKSNEAQVETLLRERIGSSLDDRLSASSKEEVLRQALEYEQNSQSHKMSDSPRKVRIESQIQKQRVAFIEDYTCQVCRFYCEYTKPDGQKGHIITIDHIIEKARGGTEELKNLWALCPNCHEKRTRGIITVNPKRKKVFAAGQEITISDNHLFVEC